MNKPLLTPPDVCPRCGAAFHCSKSSRCWCFEAATTSEVLDYIQDRWQSCLCQACLEAVAKALGKTTGESPEFLK